MITNDKFENAYKTIGEVAKLLGELNTHTIIGNEWRCDTMVSNSCPNIVWRGSVTTQG